MVNRFVYLSLKFVYKTSEEALNQFIQLLFFFRQSLLGNGYWYKIGPYLKQYPLHLLKNAKKPSAYHFKQKLIYREYVVYDFDFAIHQMQAEGIALVFFMGLGDYVMATSAIHEIRKKLKGIPLYAYASNSLDTTNSPLVADLLRKNPDIDEVFVYQGKHRSNWRFYDYSDVFRLVPKNFVVAPLVYQFNPKVRHRTNALFEAFSLPRPKQWMLPILQVPEKNNEKVLAFLNRIKTTFTQYQCKGVIFLQLDARSNNYSYPYSDPLIESLCEKGYLIVSISKNHSTHAACLTLDISNFPIWDSICLLKAMQTEFQEKLFLLGISSAFWSISAAFQIPVLGIHHLNDKSMHNYWYPNICVIYPMENPVIPQHKLFLAGPSDYLLNEKKQFDFLPEYIVQCFLEFEEQTKKYPTMFKIKQE